MDRLHGIIVPLVTPFTADDTLDLAALRENVDALIEAGVHALVAAGSTGEAISLSPTEYRLVVETVIQQAAGRVPVVAGCSANATTHVIANCAQAEALGADAIMLVHPYYSLPDERELYAHYAAVSAAVHVPVMIYNNPSTTGVNASVGVLGRLSRLPHLDYVKESDPTSSRILQLLGESEGRLTVLCGTDNQAFEQLLVGAQGWVAGVANVIPEQCVRLYDLIVQHEIDGALRLYEKIFPYLDLADGTGKFVQVNKAGVELRGRRAGAPRAPLLPLDAEMSSRLAEAVALALSAPLGVPQPA